MVSGMGYIFGAMFGVSPVTANAGDSVALWVRGIYTMPKAAGIATTIGQVINWDNTNHVATTGAGTKIGVATSVQAAGDATVDVRLNAAW
jgi:predicted RecA/RadA family phage recombinase